jgi:type IV pilus secretin PilQ/predicted competence protein
MVRMGSMTRANRILLIAGLVVLSVGPTQAGLFGRRKAEAKPAAPVAAAVMTLNAVEIDASTTPRLILRTSGSPVFNSYSPQPSQFVVDLTGASKAESLTTPSNLPPSVTSIAVDEVSEMGTRLTRVTVMLAQAATLHASAEANAVAINLPAALVAEAQPAVHEEPLPVVSVASAPAPETPSPEPIIEVVKAEPAVIAEAIPLPKAKSLKKIETSGSGTSMEVQLAADGDLAYNAFKLASPARLVIDLTGVKDKLAKNVVNVPPGGVVKKIRIAQFKSSPDPVTRVVLDLDQAADYHIVKVGDRLQVSFGEAAKIAAVDAPKLVETPASAPPPVAEVVAPTPEPVKIAAATPADVPAQVPTIAENAPTWKMPAPVAEKHAPVATARINAQTTQTPPAPAPRKGRNLNAQPAPAPAPANEDVFNAAANDQSQPVVGSSPQPTTPALGGSLSGRTLSAGEKVYTGEPISLNLKDADVKDVLRTFAQLTGLNIAVDPQVGGSVTVDFADVPWDQALEIILRQNGLGYVLEGNVMRVGTIARLSEEASATRRLAEEERLNVPTQTIAFKLSYARAADVANLLRDMASPRARIIVDPRTNQLVISEIPSYLGVMRNLIESVDIPNRQVVIEARIIETTKTFVQQYGFVWNFRSRLDPSLGTGTGLIFPNRVDIVGGPFSFGPGNSVISFSLSDVLGTFTLDVALNALETEGLVRVISAPRVMTQDNTAAEIQSGFQIPYQTRVNFTTTVAYVDATLRLTVTPQITEAGTVIMDIQVQKNEPAFGLAIEGGAGTPLATRQAKTRLMVRDGGTSVIAGIYQTRENDARSRLPVLGQLPFIGALFRNHNINNSHDELLIFITPRIVRNT